MTIRPAYALPRSERATRPGFLAGGPADASALVRLVVKVRPREEPAPAAIRLGLTPPRERCLQSYEQVVARFGADPADVDKVVAYGNERGMRTVSASAQTRMVVFEAPARDASNAFAVDLVTFRAPGGASYRGYAGPVHLPLALQDVVTAVAGFDDRPIAARTALSRPLTDDTPPPYTVAQIASIYSFPDLCGAGQRVAVLQFGNGYSQPGLDKYFADLGIVRAPVTFVPIGGFMNFPGADLEPMQDIEIIGAIAPAADIVAYFSMDTEAGWLETVTTALHDRRHAASVISICWGGPESVGAKLAWSPMVMTELDRTFAEASPLGITVAVAAGDLGSSYNDDGGGLHVVFPASSPHVLACGGTTLRTPNAGPPSEIVWDDEVRHYSTGGGVSEYFPKPVWQATANVPALPNTNFAGRGLPDVAAYADVEPGYSVFAGGQYVGGGGTSCATPLWAGLIALINERLAKASPGKTVGYITPLLYCGIGSSSALNDIGEGSNGAYNARAGWDPCTGWGSPNGTALMRALTGAQ